MEASRAGAYRQGCPCAGFGLRALLRVLVAGLVVLCMLLLAPVSVGTATVSNGKYDAHTFSYDSDSVVLPAFAPQRAVKGSSPSLGHSSRASVYLYDTSISFVAPGSTSTVRHYTTTEAAEAIAKGGEILPGPSSGRIWVTPDEYVDAATAQSRLALPNTPDGYFEFPLCRVDCPSPPSIVEPWNGHPGGGFEITTTSPIDVSDIPFVPFGAR